MTILVDWQIKEAIKNGEIKIDPFDESLINPASMDFRLGRYFTKVLGSGVVDPLNKKSFENNTYERHEWILDPGEFILASTLEKITLGSTIAAKVFGKSSIGRLGLMQSSVAGFIDPGFSAHTTLELYNYSNFKIRLEVGMKIGQYIFFNVEAPDKDYNQTGRYQRQTAGMGSLGI